MTHVLDQTPGRFRATKRGARRAIYARDESQRIGDYVLLRENDREEGLTGDELLVEVIYVTRGPDDDVPRGKVVLSVAPVNVPVAVRGDVEGSRKRRDAQGAEDL